MRRRGWSATIDLPLRNCLQQPKQRLILGWASGAALNDALATPTGKLFKDGYREPRRRPGSGSVKWWVTHRCSASSLTVSRIGSRSAERSIQRASFSDAADFIDVVARIALYLTDSGDVVQHGDEP